jgi:hypothetical protein
MAVHDTALPSEHTAAAAFATWRGKLTIPSPSVPMRQMADADFEAILQAAWTAGWGARDHLAAAYPLTAA